jgi:hypothetical protein
MVSRDGARRTLAAIRVANGVAALFAPEFLLRRLGVDSTTSQPANYAFRMFGIRTVIIGADLWLLRGEEQRRAVKLAMLIHATDTLSAAASTVRGDLPRKQGLVATGISVVNTALAVTAARL